MQYHTPKQAEQHRRDAAIEGFSLLTKPEPFNGFNFADFILFYFNDLILSNKKQRVG